MGNKLSAGVDIERGSNGNHDPNGVRHRASTPKRVGASLVEGESGAYISRVVFQGVAKSSSNSTNTTQNQQTLKRTNLENSDLNSNSTTELPPYNSQNSHLPLPNGVSVQSMNDSGYQDTDAASINSSSTACRPSCIIVLPERAEEVVQHRDFSDQSSLSDQQTRELESDNTFSDYSYELDPDQNLDEEVLQIEIEADNVELASNQTLLGSLQAHLDFEYSELANTTLISDNVNEPYPLTDRSTSTDTSNNIFQGSMSSLNFSPLTLRDTDGSRPSSVFSSPLLTHRSSGHSRTSSITSADIDLETHSVGCAEVSGFPPIF